MGKEKDKTTDELRDYLLEQIDMYNDMMKELKAKHKEADTLIKEARLLVAKLKEQE